MEGYYFNNELFTKLYVAMEMSMADILQGTGIPVGTWRNYKRSADVPLMALVKICNANRIPIEHFICWEEPKPVMIGKRHYVMANGFKEMDLIITRLRADMVKRGDMMSSADVLGKRPL